MSFRPLIAGRTTMSNAEALDIVVRHPPALRSQRVFITRRDSGKVLEHVKEFVASGELEPVVARERGTAGGLCDLIEQMRGCDTAIIHVTAGAASADASGRLRISDDVLVEIGAAMALYGREFVVLIEDGVELPPYLRGLREFRYGGETSNMPAMKRVLRACMSFPQRPSGRPSFAARAGAELGCSHQAEAAAAKH
jgi:Predicted nucleotide-binding protein containing TIR-like domain